MYDPVAKNPAGVQASSGRDDRSASKEKTASPAETKNLALFPEPLFFDAPCPSLRMPAVDAGASSPEGHQSMKVFCLLRVRRKKSRENTTKTSFRKVGRNQ